MDVQGINHFIAGALPVERQIEVCSCQHDRVGARLYQPPSGIEKQRLRN